MSNKTHLTCCPEFRLESGQHVVYQHYSFRDAALALVIVYSPMDKKVRQLCKERNGVTPKQSAMSPEHQRIKALEKKLRRIGEQYTRLVFAN